MSEKNFKEDDYLTTSSYQFKPRSNEYPEFSIFSQDGQSFFALIDNEGNVILRSEGYSSQAARNKGIESVSKNRIDETKWSIIERMGYYFLILKAVNHQEIARSGAYKTELEAESILNSFLTNGIARQATFTETTTESATSIQITNSPERVQPDILKSEEKEDDYLPCKEYEGHAVNDKENGVALFRHENGQFYFVLYNADGDVKIRSEGFETAKNRDQELSGVLKYHNDDSKYTKLQKGKYYIMILRDKNGTEVGRSCLLKEDNVVKPIENGHDSSSVASSKIVSTRRVAAKEDDYMKCDAYAGHPVTDSMNNIALFTGPDNQLYFVVYNSYGNVRLRSEGFKTEVGRNSELQAVIEHMNNPNMYSKIKKGKYYIKVLKDSIGREVARSCMYQE